MDEDELAAQKPKKAAITAAANLLERAIYTTVALRALAEVLRELDDAVGARLLDSYAAEFAEHEAGSL